MTIKKLDRRVERTRSAILRAFIELLLDCGYEAVTVEAISARANVGRSTFYMHFQGKEDILRKSMAHPSSGLARILDPEVTPAQIVPLMQHFHEQRKRNRAFFVWPIRPIWVRNLASFIEPRLKARPSRGEKPPLPVDLIALALAEMQIGLVAHWIQGRSPCRPEAVAQALVASTRACAAGLRGLPFGGAIETG